MKQILRNFASKVADCSVEIYNEFSLQHELGIHLRSIFPSMKVQFERNVSFFFSNSNLKFIKKEIDISIFSANKDQKEVALELKFPRNGQYPEQMFSFCKDICFVEQLKKAGFRSAYFIVFADDRLFYEGSTDKIYGFFRGGKELHGNIQKPTGKKNESVSINGSYSISWFPVSQGMKYTLVEI